MDVEEGIPDMAVANGAREWKVECRAGSRRRKWPTPDGSTPDLDGLGVGLDFCTSTQASTSTQAPI